MMNWRSVREYSIAIAYILFLIGIILLIINSTFPKVGDDFAYFIPRMLDTHLHHKVNGISIQWYTPSFGGGTPAYPNPQYIQYSLPQFLMFFINPWWALMVSLATYALIGTIAFYSFLKHEVEFSHNASLLGASFILANSFFVDHAIVGHVGFQSFPLFGLIVFLIFSQKLDSQLAGLMTGLTVALIVNQAGFYVLFIFALSLGILFPFVYLVRPQLFNKKFSITLLIGTISAVILSISKISAVLAFMRFFPRIIADNYNLTYFDGMVGMVKQLVGINFILPYYMLTGKAIEQNVVLFFRESTGGNYGLWENNISLAPGLLFLLVAGIINVMFKLGSAMPSISKGKVVATIFLFAGTWLVIDMTLAQGWLYSILKTLPIIKSLHVNVRFTSAFIFPFSLIGAYIFDNLFERKKVAGRLFFFLFGSASIAMLCLYFGMTQRMHDRYFNIKPSLLDYSKIDNGWNFTVNDIANITDPEVFKFESSSLLTYEAIFGLDKEYFKPRTHAGPILDINNGYYNMTQPASYVFPKENGLELFEPFCEGQKGNLELFINHKQPNFNISVWQNIANILNLTALMVVISYVTFKVARITGTTLT